MKGFVFGLFVFALLAPAWVPAEGITVDQAVQEALASNLGLRSVAKKLEIEQRDRDWSFQKFFPTITAGAGWLRWNDVSTQERLVGLTPQLSPVIFTPDLQNIGAQINVQFTLSLTTFAAVRQTLAEWDAGPSTTTRRGSGWRATRERPSTRSSGCCKARCHLTRRWSTRRHVSPSSRPPTRSARCLSSRFSRRRSPWRTGMAIVVRSTFEIDQALYGFSQLLGRRPTKDIELSGTIDPRPPGNVLSGDRLADQYLERRFDLRGLDAQDRVLQAQASQVDGAAYPQLVLGYSADPSLNDPWHNNALAGSNWMQVNGALSVDAPVEAGRAAAGLLVLDAAGRPAKRARGACRKAESSFWMQPALKSLRLPSR